MTRFLETITALGNDVLVPIDRIKHIHKMSNFNIKIVSDDGEWVEWFDTEQKQDARYQEIKNVLNGSVEAVE